MLFRSHADDQLDAAEEAASRAINLFLDEGDQFGVCDSHRLLGDIYLAEGETEKAINHFETALGIASPLNWHDQQFWIHYSLAWLFSNERQFDAAHAHIEHTKLHATNDPYNLGRAMVLQAKFWYEQRMLKEAKSAALRATNIFETLGAVKDVEGCRALLHLIEEAASHAS